MADLDPRTGWLMQVPSRVLRRLVVTCIPIEQQKHWLDQQAIGFRSPRAALNRLTVEQLIRLINAYPEEVSDDLVEAHFCEYRHGRSPTLHLFVFPRAALEAFDLAQANRRAELALPRANRELERETSEEGMSPRLQNLTLEPFHRPDGWPDGLHAGYQVQSRLDYVAVDGTTAQVYELLFGHVWVDLARAFVALHLHPARLEMTLTWLLAQILGAPLRLVRVDKELKRRLRFLQKAHLRRTRLVDPNPERQRFRSITLADNEDLARRTYMGWDYRQWEDDYPEMASARYYAHFVADRDLSLSIGVQRGSLTLAGAVSASELQLWARDTGAQIVNVWLGREEDYLSRAPAALDYERLEQHARLEDFPGDLRRLVLALVQALATIKERQDRLFHAWPLSVDVAELALASAGAEAQEHLGEASGAGGPAPWFQVMVRVDCPVEDCAAMSEYLVCPSCGRTLFTLALSDREERVLMCANAHCAKRWAGTFPLQTQCEEEHPIRLAWDEGIGQRLELFVTRNLAFLFQELLRDEAKVYRFSAQKESLWIRNGRLVHEGRGAAYTKGRASRIYVDTGGGAAILGSVNVEGDFIGRDLVQAGRVDGEEGG
jgi:hypothetical protein